MTKRVLVVEDQPAPTDYEIIEAEDVTESDLSAHECLHDPKGHAPV